MSKARLGLLLLILVAAAVSLLVVAQTNWLDDSFISFRYARNWAAGHGLVYNVGDPVEGYTNFLWTLLTGVGIRLGFEPIHFAQWMSLVAQALVLLLVFRCGRATHDTPSRSLLGPLCLLGSIAFLTYPMTGMESLCFSLWGLWTFYLLLTGADRTRSGSLLVGVALLGLALTRFDGFVLGAVLTSYPVFFERRLRSLAPGLLVFAVGMVAYNLWRHSFYGDWLPNTFHAKAHFSIQRLRTGLFYTQAFLFSGGGQIALGLGLVPLVLGRANRLVRFAWWVVALQFVYVLLVGKDWMPNYRWYFHVLPMIVLLLQEGVWCLWDRMGEVRWRRLGMGAFVTAALALWLMPSVGSFRAGDRASFFEPDAGPVIGRFLDQHLAEDALVAIEWGGIIPYYLRQPVLDTFGLTDREITRLDPKDFPASMFGRHLNPRYLARRAPEVIIFNVQTHATEREARRSVQPGGPSHYSYYMKMDQPRFGYTMQVFQVAENAWWAALVRTGDG